MNAEHSLSGVVVLVADDEPFRRDYVTQVLKDEGVTVMGPFAAGEPAVIHLDQTSETPQLAYIGYGVAVGLLDALVHSLSARGVACVTVSAHAEQQIPGPPEGVLLRPPLAAFQIHHALLALHRARTARGQ